MIECKTYRFKGHHVGDPGRVYRLEKERNEWMVRCPIKTYKERLLTENVATDKELVIIEEDIKQMIEEAVDFAIKSPYPKEKEAFEDLFIEQEGVK